MITLKSAREIEAMDKAGDFLYIFYFLFITMFS